MRSWKKAVIPLIPSGRQMEMIAVKITKVSGGHWL
jgi:hypothetical protein